MILSKNTYERNYEALIRQEQERMVNPADVHGSLFQNSADSDSSQLTAKPPQKQRPGN